MEKGFVTRWVRFFCYVGLYDYEFYRRVSSFYVNCLYPLVVTRLLTQKETWFTSTIEDLPTNGYKNEDNL